MRIHCGLGWPNQVHGTRAMYVNKHCRCVPCRKSNSDYMVAYRRVLKAMRRKHR